MLLCKYVFASTVIYFVSSQNFKLQQTEVYSCKSFRWPQVSAPVVSISLICVCVCMCVCLLLNFDLCVFHFPGWLHFSLLSAGLSMVMILLWSQMELSKICPRSPTCKYLRMNTHTQALMSAPNRFWQLDVIWFFLLLSHKHTEPLSLSELGVLQPQLARVLPRWLFFYKSHGSISQV